ncbi:MAG: hypothetical protein P8M73_08335 [Luminiphilus sp.]|jgi:hypothetical protein|nr:hypothetical protein [Luminiphilus sp.]
MNRHQHRTVIKRVHPHEWRWRLGVAGAALLVALAVGYLLGASREGEVSFFDDPEERLRDQVAQLSLEREADQQTMRALRGSLAEQASELGEMREMLALYRGVMVPEETEGLVVLKAPSVAYDAVDQSFRVVSLVHRGPGDFAEYRGELTLVVEGKAAGESLSINLAELDTAAESSVFPLRFRYLQKVQVAVSLPLGFAPETILSTMRLSEPRQKAWDRQDAIVEGIGGSPNLVGAERNASD